MNSTFMSSGLLDLQDLTLNPYLSFQPCGRELRTLQNGCNFAFITFIAFNCLTQEVLKGPNGPQTNLTPFGISAKEQGFVEHEVEVALSKAKLL